MIKYRVSIYPKGKIKPEFLITSVIVGTKNRTNQALYIGAKRGLLPIVKFDKNKHDITCCKSDILDFYRTKKAIEKYDLEYYRFQKILDNVNGKITNKQVKEIETKLLIVEEFGRLVGLAYGTDTISINTMSDCEKYIRPGPKVSPPGAELSLARRMVKKWEDEKNAFYYIPKNKIYQWVFCKNGHFKK